ncbi:Phosphatidylglycerol/phosphatidylinositol transfer protein [Penicillium angulare]|uniref:Phosphatidylglycerol/phosphatidylinositol transfer protein n=1 Tax=Penicillium angulare TaxID=116970 RepID=UPI0025412D0E|nr:Phosphatidylglycerol/phosphatidylinositol transfer protein [Penicillium angulare]KAJ5280345.1 Phosphatidylglycerol/phosphatidylinositol transfer protein [Penicillium angulare]
MRLLSFIILLFVSATSFATSFDLPHTNPSIITRANGSPVPGQNPFQFCEDPSSYAFKIDKLDLIPYPPKAGQNTTIKASIKFLKPLRNGACVKVKVSAGHTDILSKTFDICQEVKKVNLKCPLEKEVDLETKIDLKDVPSGTYQLSAKFYTEDAVEIACLTLSNIKL